MNLDQMRQAGFSDQEIQSYQDAQGAKLLDAGFSQQEVMEHMGVKQPDDSVIEKAAKDHIEQTGKPLSFTESVKAGYQESATGLALRGKLPDTQMSGQEPWYDRIAYKASNMASDFPEMVGGFLLGAPEGGPTPAAVITGTAGAFALPAAMRQTMMDAYSKGNFKNFQDFKDRAEPILAETAKQYATGAATGAAGAVAAPLAEAAGAGTATTIAAKTGAELTTMTTVGAELHGHAPSAQDFIDGAIVMLGMKGAMEGAGYLRDLYAKTGVTPDQAVAAAKQDPSVAQDVAVANGKEPPPQAEEKPAEEPVKPTATKVYTESGQDLNAAVREQDTRTPEEKILSKISVGESKPKEPMTWQDFYTKTVDKLDPIRRITDAMENEDTDSAVQNSYRLMRLLPGAGGKAQQFLENGTFDFNTLENTGKPLKEILDPVKDDLDGFRAYWAAKHAIDIEAEGKKSGFDLDAAKQVVKEGAKQYQPVVDDVVKYAGSTIDYARDAGIFSAQQAKAIKRWASYAPFNRVMDDEDSFGIGNRIKNPVKRLTGSDRTIIDPLESTIRNTYAIISLAERNAAVKTFADGALADDSLSDYVQKVPPSFRSTTVSDDEMGRYLKANGIEDVPDEALTVFRAIRTPLAKDEVGYFDKGKWQVMKVDPDLAEAFNGTPRQYHGMLFSMLRAPAAMLRAGLVNVEFIIRHLVRNQMSASILAEKGNIPFWDTFKGMISYLGKDEDYQNWLKSGGQLGAPTALDRDTIQDEITALTGEAPEQNLFDKAWNVAKTPFDVLHAVQTSLEAATRLGAFKRAMDGLDTTKENIVNAGYYSRNIAPDPGRIGSATANWNAVTALFNTEIQHTDQLVSALRDRPIPTLAKIFAGITLPSVLLWAANRNTQEWKEAHQWERDFFWLVPMGGTTLRIPKPFLLGEVFGSGAERLLDKISGKDTDNRGLEHFISDAAEWGVPNFMPTAVNPILEQITNYSFFKGQRLVPDHLMQLMPEYRYSEYTSELTKQLGRIVGYVPYVKNTSMASPMVIDNYIYKWTGGLGTYTLSLADAALRKSGVLPDPPLPTATLADIPVIKAFVVRYPSATADSIQRFQEDYQKRSEVFNTFRELMKNGDPDAALKVIQSNPAAMGKLDSINRAISQQNQLVRLIYKNPDIKPDEKRQIIDATYFNMINMARAGNEAMKELDDSMNQQPTRH